MSKRTLVILAAVYLGQSLLWGQNPTATLVGTVLDSSGAAVANAQLEVHNTDTGDTRKAPSNFKGEFTIPNLAPGPYEVTVIKDGFRTVRETDIVLQMDQIARMEFKLEVGAVSQSVEVTATAAPLINTENGTQGQVMMGDEITQMPLNGRDFSDLAYLVPGVTQSDITIEGAQIAVNGARPDNTNFLIDGFANRDPRVGFVQQRPNLDALQEFKMETNNFSAEYGQLAGGLMNMVLKSGSNRVHGTLFEFVRNDKFDARNFFDQQKSELRQNQFGGLVSGPLTIPKIYKGHDRTFFLFSWESYRQVQGRPTLGVVPSLAQEAGDFSQVGPVSDPLTTGTCPGSAGKGACFPGNKVPAARLVPQALAAQKFFPAPNLGGLNNMSAYTVTPTDWDSFILKFDERISAKDNVSFRYTKRYNRNYSPYPNARATGSNNTGLFGANQQNHTTLTGLNYTRIFRPSLINELRLAFTRSDEHDVGAFQGTDYNAQFGIPGLTTDPRLIGFPLIFVSGYQQLGNGVNFPVKFDINSFQLGDTLTWVKGSHIAKFGGDIRYSQFFQPYWNNARGEFDYTGFWTGQPYADFLMGYLNADSHQLGSVVNYLLSTNYGFFAQDDWKVSSRFTMNFGLRYEIPEPPHDKYGRTSNFIPGLNKLVVGSLDGAVPGVGFTNPGLVETAAQAGIPQALIYTSHKAFAPRFGFAWRPFGGNRTVVRGGYGIFYGGQTQNPLKNQMAAAFPFTITQTGSRSATNPLALTIANPFPTAPNLVANVAGMTLVGWELHQPTPYLQSWNFTIEKEVGFSSAVKAAYVGSKGTHFGVQINANQPYDRSAKLTGGILPYPGFGTINYFSFQSNSIYNGATLTWQRRFVRGFFYTLNYTYSKCIDESSNLNGASIGGIAGLQDIRNLRGDRGRCDWDIPHQFTMSFSWQSRARNALLRGWQFSGTGRLYSGSPFTPVVSNSNLALGEAIRPNRTGKGTLPNPNVNQWFQVSAFPVVPDGSFGFGDSGRNILDAPGKVDMNFTLFKNFVVREKSHLQLRWELFNIFNHPNLGVPIDAVNAPNAATIVGSGNARLMQFGSRYEF